MQETTLLDVRAPSASAMISTGSHVHDLVACLDVLHRWKEANPAHAELAVELEVHLCELMQAMITSPLTGKMFASLPHDHLTQEAVDASLAAQTAV